MQQVIFWLYQGRLVEVASLLLCGDVVVQLRMQMADMINRREWEISL
jgi:hypothetical protein